MTEVTRVGLSESSDGELITVAATSTVGTLIHTSSNLTANSQYDEVWLMAANIHTSDILLTIEIDIANDAASYFTVTIPAQAGLYSIAPGISMHNTKKITAFAAIADKIKILGNVDAHV